MNARALAWFFTKEAGGNVNASMFLPKWEDDVVPIAAEVVHPISQHLGHAMTGAKEGEEHPGEWPLPELAVVLVGGLSRFVDALDAATENFEVNWFTPSPSDTYQQLTALNLLSLPTTVSRNPSVAALTKALQQYLQ